MTVDRARVERTYHDGVGAIERLAAHLDGRWDVPACGDWTAAEVARHVLAVSRWYHEWFDRALAGEADPPFDADQLPAANETELAALADLDGAAAVDTFAASARRYLERIGPSWDVPFGFPFGTVTVGLHAGVAATEWHLHAWDLATVLGRSHQPADPEGLFLAAGACVARAEGGVKGAVLARLVPLGARRDPWGALLRRSGR